MILRYGDETLKIVEAFAEHDFCPLRLIGMISATNTENLSCAFCFKIYYNSAFSFAAGQGTRLWTKGLSCGQKKRPHYRAYFW